MGFRFALYRRICWTALIAVSALSGCATYSSGIAPLEQHLAAGDPAGALAFLEKRGAPDRDRVLFLLDKAMLQRLSGNYEGSNESFEAAKGLMDALETTSASEVTGSLVINDAARSYVGEPFEQALLHAYEALNYLNLGQPDEARVEALQVDERLKELTQDDDGTLAQDPFARYLEGLIYESEGELSDALIAYRQAYETYQAHEKLYGIRIPDALKKDLLRLTAHLGLTDENRKLTEAFGSETWLRQKDYEQLGELVLLIDSGLAPVKREHISIVPAASHLVTIALPYYEVRSKALGFARATLGSSSAQTETVEDIDAIAVNTLRSEMAGITARAIARAVAKYQLADRARKENPVAGLMTNLAGLFTERADTRSWLTLPGEIQMARLQAPPGDYRLHVDFLSKWGSLMGGRDFDVKLEKGRKSFLSFHWIPASGLGRMK